MTTLTSKGKISAFFNASKHSPVSNGKRTTSKGKKTGQSPVRIANGFHVPSTMLTPDASPESDTNSGCEKEQEENEVEASSRTDSTNKAHSLEPSEKFVTLTGHCPLPSSSVGNLFLQEPPPRMLPDPSPACSEGSTPAQQTTCSGERDAQRSQVSETESNETSEAASEVSKLADPAVTDCAHQSAAEVGSHVPARTPAVPDVRKAHQGRKRGRGRGGRSAASRASRNEAEVANDAPKPAKSKKDEKKDIAAKANHKITEYFSVRRSERKCSSVIKMEQQKRFEEYVLSNHEDGLKVVNLLGKGRGVIATKEFQPGEFVVEYAGELIDYEDAKQREKEYCKKADVGCYMYYFEHKNKKWCVDATAETPRLGRLMNHSRTDFNCRTRILEVNERPHLILVAVQQVEEGKELLYDYGDTSKASLEGFPWLRN